MMTLLTETILSLTASPFFYIQSYTYLIYVPLNNNNIYMIVLFFRTLTPASPPMKKEQRNAASASLNPLRSRSVIAAMALPTVFMRRTPPNKQRWMRNPFQLVPLLQSLQRWCLPSNWAITCSSLTIAWNRIPQWDNYFLAQSHFRRKLEMKKPHIISI